MGEVGLAKPMRHRLAQHAALLARVEASLGIRLRTLAGNDQDMPIIFGLSVLQETTERRMRVPLAHAMQIEARLHREPPALEPPRGLAIQRFVARDRCGLRRHFWRGSCLPGRWRLGRPRGPALWVLCPRRDGHALFERLGAARHARPQFGVCLKLGVALAHGAQHSASRLNGWEARDGIAPCGGCFRRSLPPPRRFPRKCRRALAP